VVPGCSSSVFRTLAGTVLAYDGDGDIPTGTDRSVLNEV